MLIAIGTLAGCGKSSFEWNLPAGFPEPEVPSDNPITTEKVELGRHLFFDERLSFNGTTACATCHDPARAFSDGKSLPTGASGDQVPRNAMSLSNLAYYSSYTWADPDVTTLEAQARGPMFNEHPVELGTSIDTEQILDRFRSDDLYRDLFAEAFPEVPASDRVTVATVVQAIATFERTLISSNSPWDRFSRGEPALSEAQLRGLTLFFDEALQCHDCHTGLNFTDAADPNVAEEEFRNTGLYNVGGTGAYPSSNTGLYEHTMRPEDMGRFRVPTLRNVAVTAPYMHDGSVDTLEEVIDLYARGGRRVEDGPFAGDGAESPYRSPFIHGFEISESERSDLVAFLKALTDDDFLSDPRHGRPKDLEAR